MALDFTKPGNVFSTVAVKDGRGTTYSTPLPTRTGVAATSFIGVWFDHNTREWVVAVYEDGFCRYQTGESLRSSARIDANADAQRIYTDAMVALALSMAVAA